MASALGVAKGVRQLGVRRPASTGDTKQRRQQPRKWTAKNIPRDYDFQDVEQLLQDLKFTEIEILEKFRHKARAGWSFVQLKRTTEICLKLRIKAESSSRLSCREVGERARANTPRHCLPRCAPTLLGSLLLEKRTEPSFPHSQPLLRRRRPKKLYGCGR